MTIQVATGTRLGPYEILLRIGAGGMGEVWRALDTRLDRSVAIKILPFEFAQDAQFKMRFEREAKTISRLTHPHICTLHDVGDENGVEYLVMELLDGESLADRLEKGPLPIEQVLRYGAEIAEALHAAHRAGVVHRDLKPGNVMLTKNGAKLLDFGLAKPATAVLAPLTGATLMPTEQKPLTREGMIVGTFQYMAPEQVEGNEADARTDIFALGALLYEMATGKRAFEGASKASLIASILDRQPPPVSTVAPASPPALDRVIRKCLEKDPEMRWQSAYDVAPQLRWAGKGDSAAPAVPGGRRDAIVAWIAATSAIAALLLAAALWRTVSATRSAPPVRTTILPPDGMQFAFASNAPPAISKDGTRIVFGAAPAGKRPSLWIRSTESLLPRQLPGTEGATFPFWSADGGSIGFFDHKSLKKIDLNGGAPVVICNVVRARGGSWSGDGRTIIFAGQYTPIFRVSAAGGTAVPVTKLVAPTGTHRWPEFLPDGRHFLFLTSPSGIEDPTNAIAIGSIDGTLSHALIKTANEPHYLNGAIVFTRDGTLTAQPFDAAKLALSGDAVPLNEQHIEASHSISRSHLSVAASGSLVYQAETGRANTQVLWVDRTGKTLATIGDPGEATMVALAPNQRSLLASGSFSGKQSNVSLYDLERNVKTRVTFNEHIDLAPLWSPDGRRFVYTSEQSTGGGLLLHDVATGAEEVVVPPQLGAVPYASDWSPDGRRILYFIEGGGRNVDIWWLSLDDRKPHLYVGTPFPEAVGRFSPNGKWIAYQSEESGRSEIYLAPFPPTGAKWQVSSQGGRVPRWRGDGKELYYIAETSDTLVAVPIAFDPTPRIGKPADLFDYAVSNRNLEMYDLAPDGQRFVIPARLDTDATSAPLILMQHFDQELGATMDHRE